MSLAVSRDPRSPLDRFGFPRLDPQSADYFVDTLCLARNVRERVWCHVLESLPTTLRVGVLRRQRRGDPRQWSAGLSRRDLQYWLDQVIADRSPWRATMAGPGGRIVMPLPGENRTGAVVFLFAPGDRAPAAVLKVRPSGAGAASVPHEARALRVLARALPATLRATVPSVIACGRERRTDLLLLTGFPGRPAYVDLHRDLRPSRRVAEHFRHAARWLAQFHLATRRTERPVDLRRLDRMIGQALSAAWPSQTGPDLSWVAALRAACSRAPLRAVASHGDFWARNLILTASAAQGDAAQVGVIDWEHFRPRALPSEDLFHFPLTYGLAFPWRRYRRVGRLEAFRRTFLEDNEVSREVARYLRTYCSATALSPSLLPPLLHLFLLRRAAGQARAASDDGTSWLACGRALAEARESVLGDLAPAGDAP
jgi:aminoglycoside phosphotransferase (APT) family kinase protein